jgi:hypothetical protein
MSFKRKRVKSNQSVNLVIEDKDASNDINNKQETRLIFQSIAADRVIVGLRINEVITTQCVLTAISKKPPTRSL